jgi:uncharacterized protein YbaR (Trm112 family)
MTLENEYIIPDLLQEVLVCPVCKGKLEFPENTKIHCPQCNLNYPVKDGIPEMLPPSGSENCKIK